MSRLKAKTSILVEGELVEIIINEFPIIEDLASQMVNEAVNAILVAEDLDEESPAGRDVKDAIIKSNVVGG